MTWILFLLFAFFLGWLLALYLLRSMTGFVQMSTPETERHLQEIVRLVSEIAKGGTRFELASLSTALLTHATNLRGLYVNTKLELQ